MPSISTTEQFIQGMLLGERIRQMMAQEEAGGLQEELQRLRLEQIEGTIGEQNELRRLRRRLFGEPGEEGGQPDLSEVTDPVQQAMMERILGRDVNWAGYEKQKVAELTGHMAQLMSTHGPGIISAMMANAETPLSTKGRLADMFKPELLYPEFYPEEPKALTTEQKKFAEYEEYLKLESLLNAGQASEHQMQRHAYLAGRPHIAATIKKDKRSIKDQIDDLRDMADRLKARKGREAGRKYEEQADKLEDQLIAEKEKSLIIQPQLQVSGQRLLPPAAGELSVAGPEQLSSMAALEPQEERPALAPPGRVDEEKLAAILKTVQSMTAQAEQEEMTPDRQKIKAFYKLTDEELEWLMARL